MGLHNRPPRECAVAPEKFPRPLPFPTPHTAVPSLDELVSERMWLAGAHSVVDQLLKAVVAGEELDESQLLAWERVKQGQGQ